jgi:hypothetical protein
MAICPREQYTGTIATDLFADEETTYFEDADQGGGSARSLLGDRSQGRSRSGHSRHGWEPPVIRRG